jgi:hypothetical protein
MPCSTCKREGHNKRTCPGLGSECIICYERKVRGTVTTECGHTYCIGCFAKYITTNANCAYCRQSLNIPAPKTFDTEAKRAIVNKCILDEHTFDDIYRDFYRQILGAMDNNRYVNGSNAIHLKFLCQELLDDVTLDYGMWTMGMKICDAICEDL